MLKLPPPIWTLLLLAGCGNKYLGSTVVLEPEAARATVAVADGVRHRWQLDVAVPHTFPIWAEGVDRFAATCHRLSQGRLEIAVRGQGQGAVGTNAIFEAVRDGDIAAGHAAAYYWYGTAGDALKPAVYFTTVPFGMTAAGTYAWLQEGGGQGLWDALYAPFGVKALALGSTGVQAGGWFRKPIAALADLQGLNMRIPGLGGEVLRAFSFALVVGVVIGSYSTVGIAAAIVVAWDKWKGQKGPGSPVSSSTPDKGRKSSEPERQLAAAGR